MIMSQHEYAGQIIGRYDDVAPHPAGKRAAPSQKVMPAKEDVGSFAGSCRSFVGSLMYLSRATRPDITFATNWLARYVSKWSTTQDKELEQLLGYLNATRTSGLRAHADVRDREGGLWSELWADSDHEGEAGRRSTSGWMLTLKGSHGAAIPLDWASPRQATVARSSGKAEAVALDDALRHVVGVNRGLCAPGIPTMDALEKLLGRKLVLKVFVDAAVSKIAAEKGTSNQMKYISKTQGVELFWLREVVQRVDVEIHKACSAENVADLFTKPLTGERTKLLREAIGVCGEACERVARG